MLADSNTPLWVPLVLTAWGIMIWFSAGRRMIRNPRAELHRMAEVQLKWGTGIGGDVDMQFKRLWRFRWLIALVAASYVVGTIGAWIAALTGH